MPAAVLAAAASWAELATSGPSALARAVEELLPVGDLGLVFNPLKYHRAVGHVVNSSGQLVGTAKYGRGASNSAWLSHEAEILRGLRRVSHLNGTVPVLLGKVTDHLGTFLVTDAFNGAPAPLALTQPMHDWLARCRQGRSVRVDSTTLVVGLRDRLRTSSTSGLLAEVLNRSLATIGHLEVPLTVVHGDFAPWNIVVRNGAPQVFDWEYGCLEGIPGWDEAFHTLQVGVVKRGWRGPELIEHVAAGISSSRYPYRPEEHRAVVAAVMVDLALRERPRTDTDSETSLLQALEELVANGVLNAAF